MCKPYPVRSEYPFWSRTCFLKILKHLMIWISSPQQEQYETTQTVVKTFEDDDVLQSQNNKNIKVKCYSVKKLCHVHA